MAAAKATGGLEIKQEDRRGAKRHSNFLDARCGGQFLYRFHTDLTSTDDWEKIARRTARSRRSLQFAARIANSQLRNTPTSKPNSEGSGIGIWVVVLRDAGVGLCG